ncbi:GNAT family N-acetyltransferase [Arthrobacter cavernae]|uniref:GNAT family N-acetyltransferase n=1 Tax=Arthrobacter cavernae TaxID=2817681 RepID=A0A939HE18_9MICC|nr:GNAT family protein [Arthrobacter cavernae]MBO1267484.1 GNAT family N-acetyltransferase [Arthrobacter cavernae]
MQHDVALSGHGISLVPLSPWHANALFGFVDSEMWAGMAASQPHSTEELAALFASRLENPDMVPFAVTAQRSGELLGTTSLTDYSPRQERAEIGGTFIGRPYWGSHVNTASKHLLLSYAFEVLDVHRVAFRCDTRNTRSANAIARLGAQYEGTLRGHRLAPDGSRADTAVFSILRPEWPEVRGKLLERLALYSVTLETAA